jgi:two-component system NtrC family sensor kinase
VTVLAILVALIISIILTFRLTKPLEKITYAASMVAAGNYKARSGVTSSGELGILAATFDRMLSEIEGYSSNMENLVQDKTLELKKKESQLILSEKMSALGQLAAGIAHELNTPLGAIKSSAEMSLLDLRSILPRLPQIFAELLEPCRVFWIECTDIPGSSTQNFDTRDYRKRKIEFTAGLKNAEIPDPEIPGEILADLGFSALPPTAVAVLKLPGGLDRAGRVVGALRTYAHQHDDEMLSPVDIRDQIESLLSLYGSLIRRGIQIIWLSDERPLVMGYPDKLNQVWMNLLNNAFQAMDYHGTLEIDIQVIGKNVQIQFADSGLGIPEQIQDKVFQPFFTTKAAGEGTGLGLDIVRRMIEIHEGVISFSSRPGLTVFKILLKISGPEIALGIKTAGGNIPELDRNKEVLPL